MDEDRVRAGLGGLSPEDRALIELYVEKQLGDEEIADLLQVDVSRVTERRRWAFDRLATAVGAESDGERAAMIGALRPRPVEPLPPPEPARGMRPLWLALTAVGLAAAVALVLALAGGEDEDSGDAFTTPAEEPAPGPRAALRPLAGGPARGSVEVVRDGDEDRLMLSVRGLPAPGSARYSLWLYDSVTRTRRLASFPRDSIDADVPLPRDWDRYRLLDLSREPDDSNPAHSGQSVLRVALERLR